MDLSLDNIALTDDLVATVFDWDMALRVVTPAPQGAEDLLDRGTRTESDGAVCGYGKALYRAPEACASLPHLGPTAIDLFKLDSWACGVILIILLTGGVPWRVEEGPYPTDPSTDPLSIAIARHARKRKVQLSPAVLELVNGFLAIEPSERPTMAQARSFVWFK